MNKTYYQPELYFDDGTNIGWNLPKELYSFQVFKTYEDAYNWLFSTTITPTEQIFSIAFDMIYIKLSKVEEEKK